MPGVEARLATGCDSASLKGSRSPSSHVSKGSLHAIVALFAVCLAVQLHLVFFKSFNWDEFLHFSQVYQARAGTLSQDFQVLHARIFFWAPEVASNLLDQMRAARLFSWAMHLVTLGMIYGVARSFTGAGNAVFAAFAYHTAGFVFTQAFSIRADPLVTATLMTALFLIARWQLTYPAAIAVGALIGVAEMMTLKAIFYAPCFAGLLYLQSKRLGRPWRSAGRLAAIGVAAIVAFGLVYLYHTSRLAEAAPPLRTESVTSHHLRWITADLPFARHIEDQVFRAPLFFLCVIIAPFAWRKAGLKRDEQLALAGFLAPLITLLFYRNTFPYYFVTLLAPVAVGIAPALGYLRARTGNLLLAVLLAALPLTLAMLEPRDVLQRQQALIDYVHREFPARVNYLDYSGMIADYPRILKHLTSGNGIRGYYHRGDPIVARMINEGHVPFIIANYPVIRVALEGRRLPQTFLPPDIAAMKGNYVRQWGPLWREGAHVPAGAPDFTFNLSRGGVFVLDGDWLTIDGVAVPHGARISLKQGDHRVTGGRTGPSTLWRGDKLPGIPPPLTQGEFFTEF